MNKKLFPSLVVAGAMFVTSIAPATSSIANAQTMNKITYPTTRKVAQTDDYFGTKVEDAYRWLEDDRAPETEKWVEAQNKVTFGYLEKIPFRAALRQRMDEIYNYPKYSAPFKKEGLYFFSKNDGLQNQSVLYVQKNLNGEPQVLLDPNKLSSDGTTRLGGFAPSKNARFAAYMLNQAGSDWQQIKVMDLQTRQDLQDKIEWVKISGMAWAGDGFFYSRYDAPANADKAYSAKNEYHKVFFHKVSTNQSADTPVYEDKNKDNAQRFHTASTTDDERFVILNISDRGKGKDGNAVYVRDLKQGDKDFKLITDTTFDNQFGVIGNIEDKLLVQTNKNTPNEKVVLVDPANPDEKNWKTILPERSEPLVSVSQVGGKLIATYMKDVTHRVFVFDENGKQENEIGLPALGTVGGFGGERGDREVFYTFTSYVYPPTIYRYDIARKTSTVFRAPEIKINPADYETKQVFYPSKDGTKVPMFIVHKKGLPMNKRNPTMLYAYGGFNISLNPGFSPLNLAWLEQGGVYAVANLRGGSEYGEKWHEQGMKLKKQNVFDDFIAAAEYLKSSGYTSRERLAIQGGSNGGLLVGAVMTQRPDIAGVALPAVGVMDMLRYHKFTIGYNWAAEYGHAEENAQTFKNLYAYSPLHNLKAGVTYPATLITTADHDDRVVPAHSFKFAAALQEKHAGDKPVLIRIETKSGHGASSTTKQLDTAADIMAFVFYNMNVTPKFGRS